MGGKSYFCDYCCCYMKNDINVRKKHNEGITHTTAKYCYMRQFEDPRHLLAEESAKMPCIRYMKGLYCKFDLYCQFTHFNQKQLEELRLIVCKLEQKHPEKCRGNDLERRLPWQVNGLGKKCIKKLPKRLPPSIRPIDINKLEEKHFELQWG